VSIVSGLPREQAQCQALEKKVVTGGMHRSHIQQLRKESFGTKVYFVSFGSEHASSDKLESFGYERFCGFIAAM
jgi:hypothetical protein